MTLPYMRPDSPRPRWPEPEQIMVEDGHVLLVSSEQDGPGEPHKLSHSCRLPDGRERDIDWTPYRQMTREDFRRWIDLGYPGRQGPGPLTSEQLIAMEKERAI